MRTTLDLPANLVKEAMRITRSKTKSEAIRKALEELIKSEKRMQLLTLQGRVDLDIDLDKVRQKE